MKMKHHPSLAGSRAFLTMLLGACLLVGVLPARAQSDYRQDRSHTNYLASSSIVFSTPLTTSANRAVPPRDFARLVGEGGFHTSRCTKSTMHFLSPGGQARIGWMRL